MSGGEEGSRVTFISELLGKIGLKLTGNGVFGVLLEVAKRPRGKVEMLRSEI